MGLVDPVSQKGINPLREKFEWSDIVKGVGFDDDVFLEVAIIGIFCLNKDRMLARWHIASENEIICKHVSQDLFIVFTLDGGSIYQEWIHVTQCFQFLNNFLLKSQVAPKTVYF